MAAPASADRSTANKEFVYDAGNEVLVIRSAIALANEDRQRFRMLVHAVGADEFLVAEHCAIWRCLRQISDSALEYTPETMRALAATEPTELSDEYLEEMESAAQLAPNLEWHVETLRWDATRARVVRGALPELVRDLQDPRVTTERAVSNARAVLRALEGGGGRRHVHRPEELAAVYRGELDERRSAGNFYPCGFSAIDDRLSEGFRPGNTSVITGLSGSGKSTFACKLAINFARLGRKPMVAAWEMGSNSTMDICTSMLTGVPLDCVIKGTYDDEDYRRLVRASEWVTRKIKFMENAFYGQVASANDNKRSHRSNARNQDILEGYLAEAGCDVVVMDLFDRLLADQSPDAVTEALYRQQAMHKEYGLHGVLLVQLRLKDVEKRADKRPTRESIKGVGTFVEVPDLILGVHRDAQFKDVPDEALEIICLKQRKGQAMWAVRLDWDGAACQIDASRSGGVEVPYNPGLEASSEFGDVSDPSAIRSRPKRINKRD